MPLTVHLSGHLKAYAGGTLEIDLPGKFTTVGEALDSLWKHHAGLRDRVLNEQGEIREHVNIFAGSENIKRREGLATRLTADHIHIFNAVSGG